MDLEDICMLGLNCLHLYAALCEIAHPAVLILLLHGIEMFICLVFTLFLPVGTRCLPGQL